LGCSDGKFVFPAVRRGFEVLAIDIDKIAIDRMLIRLNQTKMQKLVTAVNDSFVQFRADSDFSGVFTSGSIHYEKNASTPLSDIIESMKIYVNKNGYFFQEYIHTSVSDNDPSRHFLDKREMGSFFKPPEWEILKHRKKTYQESPNPRVDHIHTITWGSILVRRNFKNET